MIPKKPALGLDPRVKTGFPAFAKPASAGEGRSDKIVLNKKSTACIYKSSLVGG
jgi:hypothetical protein